MRESTLRLAFLGVGMSGGILEDPLVWLPKPCVPDEGQRFGVYDVIRARGVAGGIQIQG